MKPNNEHPYFKLGLTVFLSLSATVAFAFLLFRVREILNLFSYFFSTLSPLLIGFAIAYVLRPVATSIEKQCRKAKPLRRFSRLISVALTIVLALCAVTLFFGMILPQLTESIMNLVTTLPGQIESAINDIVTFLERDQEWAQRVLGVVASAETFLWSWVQNNLLNSIGTLASNIVSVGMYLINLLMSVIVAIYLLLGWERYMGQFKKLFLALSPNARFNRVVYRAMEQTNRIFSGFINGKLLDSLIVGVICFICLSIMGTPYSLLISVIVGVTNIIPVFGPFIGAIPSAFLILLVSPARCIAFLIFIVVLQQLDGNVIGPRILGSSTGLSALYVMAAMLLFGKMFGFVGMVIGVPLFATLYYIIKQVAEHLLRRRHMTVDTNDYSEKGIPTEK